MVLADHVAKGWSPASVDLYLLPHSRPGQRPKHARTPTTTRAVPSKRTGSARLSEVFDVASDEPSLHEFVLTTRNAKELGVKNIDIAKPVLDFGFYAPTVRASPSPCPNR